MKKTLLGLCYALTLSACTLEQGSLSVDLTDAPVDSLQHVYLQFSGVELHGVNGSSKQIDLDPPVQYDILALQGGSVQALLSSMDVDEGRYVWLRPIVDTAGDADSYVVLSDGSQIELDLSPSDESSLNSMLGFDVTAGETTQLILDFDLRRSIHTPAEGNVNYRLRPHLRLLNRNNIAAVKGEITPSAYACAAADVMGVYFYSGHDAELDDIAIQVEAVIDEATGTTGIVSKGPMHVAVVTQGSDGVYRYQAPYLSPGDYTLAFTCKAAEDSPSLLGETLSLSSGGNITLVAGTESLVNFSGN